MNEQRSKQALRLAIRHYWEITLKNWKTAFPGLLLTGLGTILVAYVPTLVIARILNRFQGGQPPTTDELIPYILAFAGFWLLGEIFWRIALHLLIYAESNALRQLHLNALLYLSDKDLAFFHDNFAGSLTKKTIGYAYRYVDIMDTLLFRVFPNLIPSVFIAVVLWQYSPWLVAGLFGMVGITVAVTVPLIRARRKLVIMREKAGNKVSGYVADVFSNIDAVRAFANEEFELNHHKKYVDDLAEKSRNAWSFHNLRIDTVISPLYVLTNVIGLIIALQVAKGSALSIEAVFVTFSYYSSFTQFVWNFNGVYRNIESALSDASEFTEMLIDEPAIKDIENPEKLKVTRGSIEFKDVDFKYNEEKTEKLFSNFSLRIKPGEKIGLVGHSGGGKTTLTKLLLRFMDINSGKILIDGQDISKVKQSELRKFLGYVPQDPYMFHRTITQNILYGSLNASKKELEIAAKLSHSAEFINKLPEKYNTLIGERGVKLSGGQRQRIAIARAMIKNAPILLLDEATSALDSESENLIQDALWQLMEDRTAIVIAHRLSTIQKMDRIIVLDEGRIVEQGSHKELLSKDGAYADLWKHQSGGFLND